MDKPKDCMMDLPSNHQYDLYLDIARVERQLTDVFLHAPVSKYNEMIKKLCINSNTFVREADIVMSTIHILLPGTRSEVSANDAYKVLLMMIDELVYIAENRKSLRDYTGVKIWNDEEFAKTARSWYISAATSFCKIMRVAGSTNKAYQIIASGPVGKFFIYVPGTGWVGTDVLGEIEENL